MIQTFTSPPSAVQTITCASYCLRWMPSRPCLGANGRRRRLRLGSHSRLGKLLPDLAVWRHQDGCGGVRGGRRRDGVHLHWRRQGDGRQNLGTRRWAGTTSSPRNIIRGDKDLPFLRTSPGLNKTCSPKSRPPLAVPEQRLSSCSTGLCRSPPPVVHFIRPGGPQPPGRQCPVSPVC
jgi:hypothetical protein